MCAKVIVGYIETVIVWWSWLVDGMHASLRGCVSGLSAIAWYTGAGYVLPAMSSPALSGYNMV